MSTEAERDPHAARLLRCYPRAWRERYGEEYLELLCAEIDEQPRSWRRDVDICWHGAKTRLAAAGIGALPVRDRNAIRTVQAVSLVCFLGCLVSLWSQILRGSSAAPYIYPSVAVMRIVLAATFAVIGLRALTGIISLVRRVRRAPSGAHGRALAPSLLAIGIGVTLLAAGLVSVWSTQHWAITPSRVTMIATESISTFWLHPHLLGQVPGAQLAWMVMSPLALALIVAGGIGVHRALDDGAPVDDSRAGQVAWRPVLLAPALVVSAWWVISSQQFQLTVLRAGTLDVAMIVVMTTLLGVLSVTRRAQLA